MTQQEVIQKLIELKVIVQVKNEYYLVDKKLGIKSKGRCKNFPKEFEGITIKYIYKKFLNDCEIPLQHKGNFVYLLREETKESLETLQVILNNPLIDYNVLVSKIKSYYKTVTTPKPMKKLLTEGTWEVLYETSVTDFNESNSNYVDKM